MVIKPALATAVIGELMVTAFAVVPPTEAHIRKVAPAVIAAPLLILGEALTPIVAIRRQKIAPSGSVLRDQRSLKVVKRMVPKRVLVIPAVPVGEIAALALARPALRRMGPVTQVLAVAVIPVVLNTPGIRPLVLMIATLPVVARIAMSPPSRLVANLAVVRVLVRKPDRLLAIMALG